MGRCTLPTNTAVRRVKRLMTNGIDSLPVVRKSRHLLSFVKLMSLLIAWMSETAVVLNVSTQDIKNTGNDRFVDTVVELDENNGGEHMGTLEIFHQLHCLVSLDFTRTKYLSSKLGLVANVSYTECTTQVDLP